ncbi:amidohydrolase family protein [Nocardia araoensis]|uniref:amidohydrolase family protein n=1 Tax=Nocardia araoensis TaxID=228600 RepID=UPI00031DBB5E|nr:amidohydrolase family protein [Nocardia araoensis]
MTDAPPVIDFHSHFRPPWWREIAPGDARTTGPFAALDDVDALVAFTRDGGVEQRVLGAPTELLFGPDADIATEQIDRVNEYLAELVAAHRPLLGGLATVDAFAGAAGAEQAVYAIERLGLSGIVVDSYRRGEYAGAAVTRPTFEVAAALGVPVFVHPVFAAGSDAVGAAAGQPGVSFGRGFTNGLALLSLLHGGTLAALPGLDVVFTALGTGALLFASDYIADNRRAVAVGTALPHRIHIDTLRLDVPTLRYQIDVLGPERVLVGTDWPIRTDGTRTEILEVLATAGLNAGDRALVASGNARRLFAVRSAVGAGDGR